MSMDISFLKGTNMLYWKLPLSRNGFSRKITRGLRTPVPIRKVIITEKCKAVLSEHS